MDHELFHDDIDVVNEPLGMNEMAARDDDEVEIFDGADGLAAGEAVSARESKENFEMLIRKKLSRCGAECTLSNRCITDSEFEFILVELQKHPSIATLDIGSNFIRDQ
eukprot:Sspe_Gene.113960::Locus_98814_Transcript_1_1_Confidence_1.000_Length_367::g.113960::m.113960